MSDKKEEGSMDSLMLSLNGYLFRSLLASLAVGFFLFLMVWLLTRDSLYEVFNYTQSGQVGDTIGGISAPFVGVMTTILTFLAFLMQFKANEKHGRQFMEQRQERELDRHERLIMYLMEQNRKIIETMRIGSSGVGARCFALMFYEFKVAFAVTESFARKAEIYVANDKRELVNAAFTILYNGVGNNSNVLNKATLQNFPKVDDLLEVFGRLAGACPEGNVVDSLVSNIERRYAVEVDKESLRKLGYRPFDGHSEVGAILSESLPPADLCERY